MKFFSARGSNFIGFIICFLTMLGAYYFQFGLKLEPCLLCVLQRWLLALLGLTLLVAGLHNPARIGVRVYALLTVIVALGGAAAAARQVWLQHQSGSSEGVCLPGLKYLLQTRPLHEVLMLMMRGGQDCAEITYRLWHLTLAEWSLGFFLLFALFGIIQLVRTK